MALVPFSPPPGLNSDDTTFSAEGRWADGNNVRFWQGKPQVIGGFSAAVTLGSGTRCNAIATFRIADGTTKWVFGTVSVLYGGDAGSAPSLITPVGLASGISSWSMAAWGATLLVCPQRSGTGDTLYQWTPGTAAAVVTQAPDQITYMLVTPERQVLALGCNEEVSGTFNGRCIRGCDLEDLTDWTTTATNNAFEHILDGSGRIVAGRMVGSYVAIWTDKDVWLGQFIGDPSQTYRFDRAADNCGLSGPNAVTVVDGAAFWVTPQLTIYTWSPGSPPAQVPCPVHKQFVDNMSIPIPTTTPHTTIVALDPNYQEIWIFYPHQSSQNSRYIAFSLKDGSWFRGDLARTAVLEGQSYRAAVSSWAPYLAANGLAIYVQEDGATAVVPFNWHIQSADQYLDQGERRVLVKRFIPDLEDQVGSVTLTLSSKRFPQSTATTHTAQTLTTATTKKDFRVSGMMFAAKFSGTVPTTVGNYMRLGKPLFDVVTLGER